MVLSAVGGVPLDLSIVFLSGEKTCRREMLGKWTTLCQVIPVDRLVQKKRGNSERGQREVERESDCF